MSKLITKHLCNHRNSFYKQVYCVILTTVFLKNFRSINRTYLEISKPFLLLEVCHWVFVSPHVCFTSNVILISMFLR